MQRKIVVVSFLVVLLFFGVKLSNYIIARRIIGETNINAAYLQIKPMHRMISQSYHGMFIQFPLNGIRVEIPKLDTMRERVLKKRMMSCKFRDSSRFVIMEDSIKVDYLKILSSTSHSDKATIQDYLKEHKISSNYDLLLHINNLTAKDISFFNLSRASTIVHYTLLKLKSICFVNGQQDGYYDFTLQKIKGFQYGRPAFGKKVTVVIYTKDDEYFIFTNGFNQNQIDCIINSIDKSLK